METRPRSTSLFGKGKQWVDVRTGTVFSRVQVSAQEDMEQLGMAASSPCYGIIGQKWIPTFLRMAKVSVRADTLEGREVYVLRGVTEDVEIDLWLDPSLEYAARRISFQKRASADDPTVHTHQFDAIRFQQKAGRYLVTEAIITFTRGPQPLFSPMIVEKVVDGKRVVTHPLAKDERGNVVIIPQARFVQKLTLLELDFDPKWADRDFQFSRPIANGTRVHMKDARDSNYVWNNGSIVLIATGQDVNRPSKPVLTNRGSGTIDAEERLRQVRSKARSQSKKLLVHIGSPACGWCRVLDASLTVIGGCSTTATSWSRSIPRRWTRVLTWQSAYARGGLRGAFLDCHTRCRRQRADHVRSPQREHWVPHPAG